ncbi:M20/M25/M40 family metallo-hydrolase [Aliiglaciecola lipolytica]|uniref:M20/M25/M40 family metallo-hydrolase n=1 Tax=Aliiglaciecola lipolytica TaxID=477689 RepID=UPI001C0A436E|nr:M20/M25/M40 family metallo-hydrolase [Aliiglaciecola lipolytica]MBU2879225.1 M20/M25/M40 family metallo-hydrolase [Aliiglaciecola lipolytica]
MKFRISFICSLMLISLAINAAQTQPQIESKIVDTLNQQLPQAQALLIESVNINSGTMNFSGVKKVGMLFKNELEQLGFETQWQDGAEFGRAGHLIARYGTKGPKILMIGHLDTVFAKTDAFQTYQALADNKASGPGVTDMKGGDVIIIEVMRALKHLGLLDDVSIQIVMTGDEERSGKPLSASKAAIINAAKWADIALGFEDGDGNIETAVVARRGSVDWQLDVTGRPAHSSQIFSQKVGFGAIFEGARILDTFRQELANLGDLTFNPGVILGGTEVNFEDETAIGTTFGKNNVVAQHLIVKGGIRALTQDELNTAKTTMHKIVKQNLLHTSATLVIGEGYPPMAPTQQNYQLLQWYSDISESLGYGKVAAVNPRNAGAADISFAAEHVDMALDGLGLMGTGGHTKGEIADMTSFAKNMHKAALLIYRISQQYPTD